MNQPAGGRRVTLSGAATAAAIILFVGTGSAALSAIVSDLAAGRGRADNQALTIALLLNVALILFGWRRHGDRAKDVAERTAAETRTTAFAKDPLTGLLNRRWLTEEGATMLAHCHRRRKAVALLMLDLDHFKIVNDLHGHAVGDALLRTVAEEIAGALPDTALAARFGGDEFACAMMFDAENAASIERVAERLVSRMAQPFAIDGLQVSVTLSVGIARSDADCASIDALLRTAGIALGAAKDAGRNRHVWFDRSMERELRARNQLEGALRVAIPRGEIHAYFDQQIDLTTGRLTGFEVLARWAHPQRGLVEAEHFVGIAEETGIIADLSTSVMRQAFATARDWHPAITLSVNISPYQLKDTWLAQKIIKLLTETGFAPNRLEIEITEAALFENLAMAQSTVASLKNQGIKLALDDFGTGYSSLAHLRALPFDRIKIDRSFVMTIDSDPGSAAIVNAVARLGESLNLAVTAEGIENKGIEQRLRTMGCAVGQGHAFGRPMSAGDARRLLAERRLLAADGSKVEPEPATSRRLAG